MKRTFDIVLSALGLIAAAPLMLMIALAVWIDSGRPVFFSQERMGRAFRPFHIHKFRTMVVNAPQLGAQITTGGDKRITRIGAILRATKLDEIPQLWNVLRGEMSFVGPRPEVPKYVEMFRADYAEVLRVRPGVTDPASIKYRHESEILAHAEDPERTYIEQVLPEKIALAKDYIARSSLRYDLQLLFQTLWKVVR